MVANESNEPGGRAYIGREPEGHGFGGYVASRDGRAVVAKGGTWTTVEEALDWARQHAREIVLTYGWAEDGRFSAGADPVDGLPSWPPSNERRRAIDEAIERTVAELQFTPNKIGVSDPQIRANHARD